MKHDSFIRLLLMHFLISIAISYALAAQAVSNTPISVYKSPSKINTAIDSKLQMKIDQNGYVRVIIGLESKDEPHAAYSAIEARSPQIAKERRNAITRLQGNILSKLNLGSSVAVLRQYLNIPYLALTIDSDSLNLLKTLPEVVTIREDVLRYPILAQSIPITGADSAWGAGFSGLNQTIAVLDTGVDTIHEFLLGRTVAEACFSTTYPPLNASSLCSDGSEQQIGVGSGINCSGISGCDHGTHVAGIALGNGNAFSGVAKDANLITIKVFSKFDNVSICGNSSPCILAFDSDTIAALDHVYLLKSNFDIASVNLSLGGGFYASTLDCDLDNPAYKEAIDNLRAVEIATLAASGNNGYTTAMGAPACISSAISVGATNDFDNVASFSNSASFLSLLAPGVNIYSSVPNNTYANFSGTSMATPHVSGSFAVLKSASPGSTVSEILDALKNTGVTVLDSRNNLLFPRIQVDEAINLLSGGTSYILSFVISTDNVEEVYVNGQLIGGSNVWKQASNYSVALQDGINVLAVKATDLGGVAGLIADLAWNGNVAVSDNTWKVSTAFQTDWNQIGFDASTWSNATSYGFYGVSPWLERVVGFPLSSSAQWIWSSDNYTDDVAYFRYEIIVGDQDLAINTASLPNGNVGVEYSQMLSAIGGTPPYNWSIISGGLPVGLNIDSGTGSITGIPDAVGTFDFTVEVQDNIGNVVSKAFSITIDHQPPVLLDLIISTDNVEEVYVNGQLIGGSNVWKQASNYSVALQDGINVLAVKATDLGGVAGLIADLAWNGNVAVSDNTWKVSTAFQTDWNQIGFDASTWSNATSYGFYGVSPWLERVVGFPLSSSAQWIWSSDNYTDDVAYFRYEIIVGDQDLAINTASLPNGNVGVEYSPR